nr:hypothetical protein [Tanacetum cinerariifolium]
IRLFEKKTIVVTSDPLALIAEMTNKITALLAKAFNQRKFYSKPTNNNLSTSSSYQSVNKKQEFVKTDTKKVEKKDDEKKRDMSRVKCYNCKKEGHFAKDCKKEKVKDYDDSDQEINANMVFMAQIKKVLSDSEASSSSVDEKISEVSYYLSESESESEYETSEYYDNSTNYGLFLNNDDDQEIFHDAIDSASKIFIINHIDSQKDYDKSDVDHNDSEEKDQLVDKLIRKFNKKIVKCQNRVEKANQQSKDFENQNKDLQDKYGVMKNQTTTFEMNNNELNEQMKDLIKKNNDLLAQTKVLKEQLHVKHVVIDTHVECQEKYAKLEAERYEYMIRYSAYFDNDKQHRKQIADQQVLKAIGFKNPSYFEKAKDLRPTLYDEKVVGLGYILMFLTHSDEALEIEKFKRSRENKIEFAYDYGNLNANSEASSSSADDKISKVSYYLSDLKANLSQTNQTVHMIMPSKDNLYNGRKRIGFENPRYFEKAKDLRPTLYDEKVIGLGYTPMFLTHSDEVLEIKKFKRSRKNKIEFAYDYGNLNASYVNEKINFEDGYFQEIINPNFEKIDSSFQQTSSLKPYVSNVILEKIIIDLEDEVVNLLEKEKVNLEIIESLKLKGFEWSENVSSKSENQTGNNCIVVEKECNKEENSKVIAPGMLKLNVSQYVSSISMSKSSCDSKNVEIKLKRKRRYTLMFLTHSDEALEIEKFKRERENKIKFAYDYGSLNASCVNEKINFLNDYFQEIINPCFDKTDSSFQQTSSLKPYVPNVIFEKIITDLEDEVVSLLEKEKANLETIESLKLKGFESSENAISESENQSENDCQVVEKECNKVENSKVIAPGMFKLSVSQSVSPIFLTKTSSDSKNVENKTKRKRRKRKSSKQNDKQVNNDVSRANSDFVHFSDLDKHSGVISKKKWSSNASNVDLSSISHLKLNKDVKRYSRKFLLSCNNSHLGETSSAYVCNDAMNVSRNSRLCDSFDENNFLSLMMKVCLPKIEPLAELVAKWIPKIVQICIWIIDSGCSKHMMGNRALLTNFV